MKRAQAFILSIFVLCSSFAPQVYSPDVIIPVSYTQNKIAKSTATPLEVHNSTANPFTTTHPESTPLLTEVPVLPDLATPIVQVTLEPPIATRTPTPSDPEYCLAGIEQSCRNPRPGTPPSPPAGFVWKRLEGRYSFSAYAHPGEEAFMGDMIEIPGIENLKAKEGFLYGVDGIGMQGGGFIQRTFGRQDPTTYYIRYISGHWEINGRDVFIMDEWYYLDTGAVVPRELIGDIRLNEARFAIADEPSLTPYYSIAAPSRFEVGTKLYVPGLESFGGVFEVQDRGGAFGKDSQRFDIYVGRDMLKALEWLRLGQAREDLEVYILEKKTE